MNGAVHFVNGTVRFVKGTVYFVNGRVRFVNGTIRFVNDCTVRFVTHPHRASGPQFGPSTRIDDPSYLFSFIYSKY